LYHIELDRKTKDDKTVFDIVHGTKDMDMLEYLLRYQMGKEIEELYKMIGTQKESIHNVKKEYEITIKDLKYQNKILNFLVYIVSFALVLHVFI
jgi:serine/threonine-protein kinase RIO1